MSAIFTSSALAIASTVDQPGFANPRSIFERCPTVIPAPCARASCVISRSFRSSRIAVASGDIGLPGDTSAKFSETCGIDQLLSHLFFAISYATVDRRTKSAPALRKQPGAWHRRD